MANIVPNSFKSGLLKGTFNFDTSGNGGNEFKCALYTSISNYSVTSTVFLSGTGQGEVNPSVEQVIQLVERFNKQWDCRNNRIR